MAVLNLSNEKAANLNRALDGITNPG